MKYCVSPTNICVSLIPVCYVNLFVLITGRESSRWITGASFISMESKERQPSNLQQGWCDSHQRATGYVVVWWITWTGIVIYLRPFDVNFLVLVSFFLKTSTGRRYFLHQKSDVFAFYIVMSDLPFVFISLIWW